MINSQHLSIMTAALQKKAKQLYANHPLHEYIDWEAYMESEDGNEMHFVRCIDTFIDENEKTNIVLDLFSDENDIDYYTVYVIEDDAFYQIPV